MKRRIELGICAAAVALGSMGLRSASANLLTNGSFEGPTASVSVPASVNGSDILPVQTASNFEWKYSTNAGNQEAPVGSDYNVSSAVNASIGLGPEDGSWYLAFEANSNIDDCIGQWVPTTPGEKYTVSFWVAQTAGSIGNGSTGLLAYWGNSYSDFSDLLLSTGPSAAGANPAVPYREFTFTATGAAGQSFSVLEFHGADTGGAMLLDNVDVEAVPEPATLGLLTGSLVLAAGRRRRTA